MTFLPHDLYSTIEHSIPIACVDFIPIREAADGTHVGLILRESPFGDDPRTHPIGCHSRLTSSAI